MSYQRNGPSWVSYSLFPSFAQDTPLAMMMKSQEEAITSLQEAMVSSISSTEASLSSSLGSMTDELSQQLFNVQSAIWDMHQEVVEEQKNTTKAVFGLAQLVDRWGALFDTRFTVLLQGQESIHKEIINLNHLLTSLLQTAKSPRMTQSAELRELAYERLQHQWLDKARGCFLQSYELDDTNFFTLFELGKLYLYGDLLEKESIDLQKASHFLRDALRFWQPACGAALKAEAELHLSQVSFILGNEAYLSKNIQIANEHYEQMRVHAKQSMDIFYIPEAAYLQAKASLFLSKPLEELIHQFSQIIRYDFSYLLRLRTDTDCAQLAPEILAAVEKDLMENGYSKTPQTWCRRQTVRNLTLMTLEYLSKQNFYAAFLCFKQAALLEPEKVIRFFDTPKYKEFWQEMIASVQIVAPRTILDQLRSKAGGIDL